MLRGQPTLAHCVNSNLEVFKELDDLDYQFIVIWKLQHSQLSIKRRFGRILGYQVLFTRISASILLLRL